MGKGLQYLLPRIKILDISAMADNRNSFCSHNMCHLIWADTVRRCWTVGLGGQHATMLGHGYCGLYGLWRILINEWLKTRAIFLSSPSPSHHAWIQQQSSELGSYNQYAYPRPVHDISNLDDRFIIIHLYFVPCSNW